LSIRPVPITGRTAAIRGFGGPHVISPALPRIPNDSHQQVDDRHELERLRAVEHALAPRVSDRNQSSRLLHALLTWGPQARFIDGSDHPLVIDALLDNQKPAGECLFYLAPDGLIRVNVRQRASERVGEAHHDQALAILAVIGISLDRRIAVEGGVDGTTLRDAFNSMLSRFSPGMYEAEWSAISIATYLPPLTSWKTRWNEEFTISDLARSLLKADISEGSCGGSHKLQSLCVLLRVNERFPILDASTAAAIDERLQTARSLLIKNQLESGAWTTSWAHPEFDPSLDLASSSKEYAKGDAAAISSDRLLATGHHLDWLSIAPAKYHPPEDVIIKAVNYCREELLREHSAEEFGKIICPVTHALMAVYRCVYSNQLDGRWLSSERVKSFATQ
jgi:hypothetical protein